MKTITPSVLTVGLYDRLFSHNPSATANQPVPETFRYVNRATGSGCDVILVTCGSATDDWMRMAQFPAPTVLWNPECPDLIPWPSDDILDRFDLLLSADLDFVSRHANAQWLTLVGTWITDFSVPPKTKSVSFLASDKRVAYTTGQPLAGYTLRHEIAASGLIPADDMYGAIVGRPVATKDEALKPYRFSAVVENDFVDGWATEKIFDCYATKTVPIYRGTSWDCLQDIGLLNGGPPWDGSIEDLRDLLENIDSAYPYWSKEIEHNYRRIQELRCTEILLESILRERFDLR